MYEEMRVKYLAVIDMRYRTYVCWQIGFIVGWLLAAVLFFLFGRESETWLVANAWWLCLMAAFGEAAEAALSNSKAKREFNSRQLEDD